MFWRILSELVWIALIKPKITANQQTTTLEWIESLSTKQYASYLTYPNPHNDNLNHWRRKREEGGSGSPTFFQRVAWPLTFELVIALSTM